MKKPRSTKRKNASPTPVSVPAHVLRHYQPKLKVIKKSWETLLALKSQKETAFQQMLEFYDELDKEIEKLESREQAIVSKIAEQQRIKPAVGERKTLLGISHGEKLNLTSDHVAYWRKKLGEKRKGERPRFPEMIQILELKQKYPSLGAAAILGKLYPDLKKRKRERASKWEQMLHEVQKVIDWYTK